VTRPVSLAAVVLSVSSVASCVPAPSGKSPYTIIGGDPRREAHVPDVGQAEWTLSRERLARMRSELPRRPYAARVAISVSDPIDGRMYRARGAVAVSPERAARLVLIGPGGTTALDAWVTRDRYRLSIPAMKLEKRGGVDLTSTRGLPIAFLRWWFLSPLEGELVLARSSRSEAAFLLRDGPATVTMRTDGERFIAIRREGERLEGLQWAGRGLSPQTGAHGQYIDGEWGMRVSVFVEELLDEEPDPAAFSDPNEKDTTL
jgi:hypothetical protein